MAAGSFPLLKKMKVEDGNEDIFASFHKNRLDILKDGIAIMNIGSTCYGVGVVKIKSCNAICAKCFSNATCHCEQIQPFGVGDPPDIGVKMRGIFQHGFKILEAYIESPRRAPLRKGARIALRKLLEFLSEIESAEEMLARLAKRDICESEWTAVVAHHLLSKLAVGANYILDNVNKGRLKDSYCPCGCNEKLFGCYGDTSMGVPSYWHGRVDILMDVAVTIATEDPDSPGARNCSMESSSKWMIACKEQIRAEAIVFSFLQKKRHPDLNNFLIPTIAISKSQVAVCLYDCENDVFLETPLLELFQGEYLRLETIITLWLVLNYEYCCSGVPEEIMDLKANFFGHVGLNLENYISDVRAPCCYKTELKWCSLRGVKNVKEKLDDININLIP